MTISELRKNPINYKRFPFRVYNLNTGEVEFFINESEAEVYCKKVNGRLEKLEIKPLHNNTVIRYVYNPI